MSIETLIKKYEEELPKRWTREGKEIPRYRRGVTIDQLIDTLDLPSAFENARNTEWRQRLAEKQSIEGNGFYPGL